MSADASTSGRGGAGAVARIQPRLEELGGIRSETLGQVYMTIPKGAIEDAVRSCRRAGFEQLSDVMGIDWLEYPGHQAERFTVVYNLYSLVDHERLMLRVNVEDGERIPSITPFWRAASFMEREVYDMFGIEFAGHPDLRKLLTPEDLDGSPHRKDFPLGETPVLFNEGRYIDPYSYRAGLIGAKPGLTGWRGGARRGVRSEQGREDADPDDAGTDGSRE